MLVGLVVVLGLGGSEVERGGRISGPGWQVYETMVSLRIKSRKKVRLKYLAVEEVLFQAMAHTADSTLITMIDVLVHIITPELADAAVVGGCTLPTLGACIRCFLCMTAKHAEHVFGQFPRQNVLLCLIMAKSAGVPLLAGSTLNLNIPLVM